MKNATYMVAFFVFFWVRKAIGPAEHEERAIKGAFFVFGGGGSGCAGKNIS